MRMPASGDDDSPIANRGCRPRSRSATRSPHRRATMASIEPPKPEPTMARSTSIAGTRDRRRHRLLAVHARQARRAVRRAVTIEEPFDIPEVGEHPHVLLIANRLLHHPLEIAEAKAWTLLDGQR